jgi:hypothetical protein
MIGDFFCDKLMLIRKRKGAGMIVRNITLMLLAATVLAAPALPQAIQRPDRLEELDVPTSYFFCSAYNRARPEYDGLDAEAAKPYQKTAELFLKAAIITDSSKPEAEVSQNVGAAKSLMVEQQRKGDAQWKEEQAYLQVMCRDLEAGALALVEAAEEEAMSNAT